MFKDVRASPSDSQRNMQLRTLNIESICANLPPTASKTVDTIPAYKKILFLLSPLILPGARLGFNCLTKKMQSLVNISCSSSIGSPRAARKNKFSDSIRACATKRTKSSISPLFCLLKCEKILGFSIQFENAGQIAGLHKNQIHQNPGHAPISIVEWMD